MDSVLMWLSFAGAWMLVAGPLYQGALELLEADFDKEGIEAATSGLVPPPSPSAWWWLLPPVMLIKNSRNSKAFHEEAMTLLTPEQLEQFNGFRHKATGWLTVSAGAFFLALRETWDLVEHYEWPVWVFWALTVFLLGSALGNTVSGNQRYERKTEDRRSQARRNQSQQARLGQQQHQGNQRQPRGGPARSKD